MSGSPGGLRAVPSVAAASSVGAASGPREASRGGGQRHSRIPFCSSGLQAGCGRTSQCSTRQTDIQQQASAAQRVPGPARHLGALAVTLPTGCLQPVGLAPALVARGPACCSATSKRRTFKVCANSPSNHANRRNAETRVPKRLSGQSLVTLILVAAGATPWVMNAQKGSPAGWRIPVAPRKQRR